MQTAQNIRSNILLYLRMILHQQMDVYKDARVLNTLLSRQMVTDLQSRRNLFLQRRKTFVITVLLTLLFSLPYSLYADIGPQFVYIGTEEKKTYSVAWGDWDNDGDLDLAVGNGGNWQANQENQVYENIDGQLVLDPLNGYGWESTGDAKFTTSVAWGDWDGDGDLDLAVGNRGKYDPGCNCYVKETNQVYENDGGTLKLDPANGYGWESTGDLKSTQSVAWGDWDNDGDLDLAVGNGCGAYWDCRGYINEVNQVYENDGGTLKLDPANGYGWESTGDLKSTQSVVWGDWDNDGDLDLAVGNGGDFREPNQVYENDGGTLKLDPANGYGWESTGDLKFTQSVAWGDWDGDGDLDLAIGNGYGIYWEVNQIYENYNSTLMLDPINGFGWESVEQSVTNSVAWGDWDNDGDLDLAVGNEDDDEEDGFVDYIYENDGGTLKLDVLNGFGWNSNNRRNTRAVAWGDIDNDGDLDLATGYRSSALGDAVSRVYLNDSGGATLKFDHNPGLAATSMAVGDWDNDGDLDVAVANPYIFESNCNCYTGRAKIYENDNGVLKLDPSSGYGWDAMSNIASVTNLAWGDWDSDGDLDLAVAHRGGYDSNCNCYSGRPNQVYENDGGTLKLDPSNGYGWESIGDEKYTASVAWGDWDGDGDLDLAVGNGGSAQAEINQVYENDSGTLKLDPAHGYGWESTGDAKFTTSVAWGDWDGDGDLDLAVGNVGNKSDWRQKEINQVYENNGGTLKLDPAHGYGWESIGDARSTQSVAWGDWDSDGDLDLAIGNYGDTDQVYENDAGTLKLNPINGYGWESTGKRLDTNSVNWGDWDGDGDLDLAIGGLHDVQYLNNEYPLVFENDGGTLTLDPENGFGWQTVEGGGSVQAWADLDRDGDLDLIDGYGGVYKNMLYNGEFAGNSLRATISRPGASDPLFNLPTAQRIESATIPIPYTLFGPSTQRVRQLRAFYSPNGGGQWFPAVATPNTVTGNLLVTNEGTPHVFYWDTLASGFYGQSDNMVFRMELSSSVGPFQYSYLTVYSPHFSVLGTQVRVYHNAVLSGNEAENAIVYRIPFQSTQSGAVMRTEAGPLRTGSNGYLQGRGELGAGDQLIALYPYETHEKYTLYHTSAKPITDTDLAPNGLATYHVRQSGVQTLTVSSDNPLLLFDLTVSLEWDASNDTSFLTLLETNLLKSSTALYDWTDGQVALGKVIVYQAKEQWNEADIRIYASNQVRPVANRGGIVRNETIVPLPSPHEPITATRGEIRIGSIWNRYGDANPTGNDWPNVLAHELGHYLLFLEDTYLGLNETNDLLIPITTCTGTAMTDPYDEANSELHYDLNTWLRDCATTLAELPEWDLMQLAYPALKKPISLNSGPPFMPFAFTQIEVRAAPPTTKPLLIDNNIALNGSESDLVNGRAYLRTPGQRIVDMGRPVLGSLLVHGARVNDELCIFAEAKFVCTALNNSAPPAIHLLSTWKPQIELTPINTTTFALLVNSPNVNSLTVTTYPGGENPQTTLLTPGVKQVIALNQPAVEVWVDIAGEQPEQRIITEYVVGSGPGRLRSHDGPGRLRSHDGPFTSGDGRVTLYPPTKLDKETFIALQTATTLPNMPAGLTAIGRSYYVRPSQTITDFSGGSIAFQYLGLDVLLTGVPEKYLTIYHWNGEQWRPLPTELNTIQNFASAQLNGAGLYALFSGFYTPLTGNQWNSVYYPLQGKQPVVQALASVDGYYTLIYGYVPAEVSDPWKVYSPTVPDWVNDLHELEPEQFYQIYATGNITWTVASNHVEAAEAEAQLRYPPSTFYGFVPADNTFIPTVEMLVTARVNGNLCGQARTRLVDGQIGYVIDVLADDLLNPSGCGRPGQTITFTINGQVVTSVANWDNTRMQQLDLMNVNGSSPTLADPELSNKLYLPLITNQ